MPSAANVGAAAASSFIAGAGALTGPAAPLTIGTAAGKNIPATGNASATEVVYGSDTRLTDTRTPASHTTGSHSDWPSAVSMTELGYLDGVTSGIQAQLGTKKVLQVVIGYGTTSVLNTTTTYASAELSASITPASASNKVLVLMSLNLLAQQTDVGAGGSASAHSLLKRDSTIIQYKENTPRVNTSGTLPAIRADVFTAYLDSPATTSAVTYSAEICSGVSQGRVTAQSAGANGPSVIVLLEIAP
jgi:hypothetical protein